MFKAKILKYSVHSEDDTKELLTMELVKPRMILPEFNTHRSASRNSASSRAIPVKKMLMDVEKNPFIPIHIGKAQKGMQAYEEVPPDDKQEVIKIINELREKAMESVNKMLELGVHKQVANRYLEPWMWITVIKTASIAGWANFWNLRRSDEAEPHIRKIADMSFDEFCLASPEVLHPGEWHLPLIGFEGDELLTIEEKIKVSTGRCARVSYLTHDGRRDVSADIALHDKLLADKHFSPFEHVVQAANFFDMKNKYNGNLGPGWIQYRKTIKGEFQDVIERPKKFRQN